jgi:hypothetical protein
MDPAIELSKLVATVFTSGPLEDPHKSFIHFLHKTDMIELTSERDLKCASIKNPLVVTEYLFELKSADLSALRKSAYEWGKTVNTEVVIQRDDVFRRYKRLVVFDMDSTLIKQEVIDEIALYLDSINPEKKVGTKVAVIVSVLSS